MANNFKNAIVRDVSNDEQLPHAIYITPDSKKSIAIELDVANNSSAGVNCCVLLEDEDSAGTTAFTINNSGTFSVLTANGHGLKTNDIVRFNETGGTAPGGLVGGARPTITSNKQGMHNTTSQGLGKMYYVTKIDNNTFKIGNTRDATTFIKATSAGTSPIFRKLSLVSVVRNAPIPVGGTLKVISGQKLVLQSDSASLHDKIYVWASSTGVDAVISVLEDVS